MSPFTYKRITNIVIRLILYLPIPVRVREIKAVLAKSPENKEFHFTSRRIKWAGGVKGLIKQYKEGVYLSDSITPPSTYPLLHTQGNSFMELYAFKINIL